MRSAADLDTPNRGASWRSVRFVRQYAATRSTRSSSGRLQGRPLRTGSRTLAPQSGDQLAELPRAQPGERGYPGRLRRRDHTRHGKIISPVTSSYGTALTVSTGVPSRPTFAASAYSMTITGSFGKVRPSSANPWLIHRS